MVGSLAAASTAHGQMGVTNGGTTRKFVSVTGGNGSSFGKAIVIHAHDWTSGVDTEYAYVSSHFPGAKVVNFSRQYSLRTTYDIITFTTRDGKTQVLYFDYRKHY